MSEPGCSGSHIIRHRRQTSTRDEECDVHWLSSPYLVTESHLLLDGRSQPRKVLKKNRLHLPYVYIYKYFLRFYFSFHYSVFTCSTISGCYGLSTLAECFFLVCSPQPSRQSIFDRFYGVNGLLPGSFVPLSQDLLLNSCYMVCRDTVDLHHPEVKAPLQAVILLFNPTGCFCSNSAKIYAIQRTTMTIDANKM